MSLLEMTPSVVEGYLNEVNYVDIDNYVPSNFALEFVNFIKLVNGNKGEENATPVVHYRMLDSIVEGKKNICNMSCRGIGKTALTEYLFLYLGVYGELPDFGDVNYALYVGDSIENNVKKLRYRLERRWENSDFLKTYIPKVKFTDIRWYFQNAAGKEFVVTGHGAKALSLDTILYTESATTTIGSCNVGDRIFGPDGKLAKIIEKSEIFHKPMYELQLADERSLKVSEDHINSVLKYGIYKDLTTKEMLEAPLYRTKINGTKNYTFQIQNTKPLEYTYKQLAIDPYTLGLLLGDGSIKKDGSTVLHGHKDDINFYVNYIPYTIGTQYLDKRNNTVLSISLLNLSDKLYTLGLKGIKSSKKFIPESYFYGSISQRLALLRGLIDTDGSVSKEGKVTFNSTSKQLCKDITRLVRSLGGIAKIWKETTHKYSKSNKVGIWLNFNTALLPRKALREKFNKSNKIAVIGINRIEDEPSQCIAIDNISHQFLAGDYIRTHNTGVRGTTELNTRPQIAVLDDLLSDEDARSATVIASIEEVVYKAINYALHPSNSKIIWSGTPFNAKDPLYKAVESGAWEVNVYPVCEEFPCQKAEFKSAWPDRFTYDYVKERYEQAVQVGRIDTFNQELMLRIMSDEDRLIEDGDIIWYERNKVVKNKDAYNFYITTDFATTEKTSGDFSVISVWAYNNNGDWMWVDGICKKQLMDKNIDELFRFCSLYNPQSVGIEVTGQQSGFIPWIQREMLEKNIFFNLATENNSNIPGIRPNTNKMQRFNVVVPWFKMHKVWFPEEMKGSDIMAEAMNELTLISAAGMKSKHDDFLDTISQLASLKVWKPNQVATQPAEKPADRYWLEEVQDEAEREGQTLDRYVV
jgi:predicted phage terminase large subunit-like protein